MGTTHNKQGGQAPYQQQTSCAARGASPIFGDDAVAEQDSPACLVHQHSPESPVIHDTLDGKKRRLVTVQDYPWMFVSPQLLDRHGQEIFYPVENDRDWWWAGKMEWAFDHHRDLAERDLDDQLADSLDIMKKVQQNMEMENCCFCCARNEHNKVRCNNSNNTNNI
jgi:hypothetical protein